MDKIVPGFTITEKNVIKNAITNIIVIGETAEDTSSTFETIEPIAP